MRRPMSIALFLGALCFLMGAIPQALAQGTVTIEGRVLDLAGQPFPHVKVSAFDPLSSICPAPPAICGTVATVDPRSDGTFSLTTPRAVYVVMTSIPSVPLGPALVKVDARGGSVSGVLLRLGERTRFTPDVPPRASLIHVTIPDAVGDVTVTGSPGCVAPGSFLTVVTLDTGHIATTQAADDGSFQVSLFAPFGSSILIKVDAMGLGYRALLPALQFREVDLQRFAEWPGTIVRVVEPPALGGGVPFGRAGMTSGSPGGDLPAWTLQGTMSSRTLAPGVVLEVDAMLRIASPAVQQATTIRAACRLTLERADRVGSDSLYASTLLTPTGLPIERGRGAPGANEGPLKAGINVEIIKTATDRAEARVQFSLPIPASLPAGYYLPVVQFQFDGISIESPPTRLAIPVDSPRRDKRATYLPMVKVGTPAPPRIPSMLLLDTLSDGVRGAHAIEDRGRFALSSRIRVVTDAFVVPRLDAAGQPWSYSLEPFAPSISVGVSARPDLPRIPFRFPSGSLTVRLQKPDGSITTVGPAPFAQPRLRGNALSGTSIRDPLMEFTAFGGNVIRQTYQLSTLDPRFDVQFSEDGRHVVDIEGTIDDIWGNTWTLGGTYEIHVGRLLTIETSVVPGTPFEVGDIFGAGVVVTPPVPADVQVRVRLAPNSDPARMIERVEAGRANRFGYFHASDGITFNEPGEYRVDVSASYTDARGNLWMGVRTWGSVVAPRDTPIIAHGRRGMINSPDLGSPWYFRTQTNFPTVPTETHPMPPFFSGDVIWAQKSDTEFAQITFQDPSLVVTDLLRTRRETSSIGGFGPGTFEERVTLGELPLFSSRADGIDPHIDPAKVDLWGYSYRFIERPLIAVREAIAEDTVQLMYWGFNDPYAGQIGMSFEGDLPNDFKFQFGGAVLHGPALARPLYAGYASLFVLVPDNDPHGGTRVFPPFQGNGGGSSGGPLFALKGKDIDMFLYLTAVRPGVILEVGQTAVFAGHIAPTLPSKVEITVTSPSGRPWTVSGLANRVGYFLDARPSLLVDEPGVWKAKVKVWFDGKLGFGGQVTAPYPTGDVLGSRAGEFFFYVVDRASDPLQLEPMPQFVRPDDGPIVFRIIPPAGLRDLQMHYTATMPGFVLEEGATNSLTYVYDVRRLRVDFPNLDTDTITVSLLLSGTDSGGARRYLVRQVVLRGEEVLIPEQEPQPVPRRRRAARH